MLLRFLQTATAVLAGFDEGINWSGPIKVIVNRPHLGFVIRHVYDWSMHEIRMDPGSDREYNRLAAD